MGREALASQLNCYAVTAHAVCLLCLSVQSAGRPSQRREAGSEVLQERPWALDAFSVRRETGQEGAGNLNISARAGF